MLVLDWTLQLLREQIRTHDPEPMPARLDGASVLCLGTEGRQAPSPAMDGTPGPV
jgi:hypothetical protein